MLKRRDFLKISSATAAMIAGEGYAFAKTGVTKIENAKENYPNTSYSDEMYRNEFGLPMAKKRSMVLHTTV